MSEFNNKLDFKKYMQCLIYAAKHTGFEITTSDDIEVDLLEETLIHFMLQKQNHDKELEQYKSFIKEISKQEILNKKGNKPTKLALRAKELLERFK